MRRASKLFLCLILAGNILLSGCTGGLIKTQVVEVTQAAPTMEDTPTFTASVLEATPTQIVKSTQIQATPTKSLAVSVTPTVTITVSLTVRIDNLLNNLFSDLENTEIIQETEIP